MFAPNVLYLLPCEDSTFTTLFVKGIDFLASTEGSWAATMNCSFNTSWRLVSTVPRLTEEGAYQNSNHGVMVGVVHVVRDLLYDVEETADEVVVNARCGRGQSERFAWQELTVWDWGRVGS